jgi:DNA-binding MarR family transcriptional regulator
VSDTGVGHSPSSGAEGEPPRDEVTSDRQASVALASMIRGIDGYRFRAAADAQVGLTELRAMGHLIDAGPLSPKQLAAALDLTTGTVTALLDRLERGGLVQRTAHPRDRRMLQVELTSFGHEKMDSVMESFHSVVAAAADGMSPERLDAAVEFLQRVRAEIISQGLTWRRTPETTQA